MTNLGKWIRRGFLLAFVAAGSWFGLIFVMLMQEPVMAIQAYTTGIYSRIPDSFASAFLRWAPYDPNSKVMDEQPLLHFACAGYGLDGTNRAHSIHVVRTLVGQGADIDSRFKGMTSLHEAILYSISDRNTELVRTLLDLGANPELKIARPGTAMNGLTAVEYAQFLARKHPVEMQPVIKLLRREAI